MEDLNALEMDRNKINYDGDIYGCSLVDLKLPDRINHFVRIKLTTPEIYMVTLVLIEPCEALLKHVSVVA